MIQLSISMEHVWQVVRVMDTFEFVSIIFLAYPSNDFNSNRSMTYMTMIHGDNRAHFQYDKKNI